MCVFEAVVFVKAMFNGVDDAFVVILTFADSPENVLGVIILSSVPDLIFNVPSSGLYVKSPSVSLTMCVFESVSFVKAMFNGVEDAFVVILTFADSPVNVLAVMLL